MFLFEGIKLTSSDSINGNDARLLLIKEYDNGLAMLTVMSLVANKQLLTHESQKVFLNDLGCCSVQVIRPERPDKWVRQQGDPQTTFIAISRFH